MISINNSISALTCAAACVLLAAIRADVQADVVQTVPYPPGSASEASIVLDASQSKVLDGSRTAEVGGGWTYRISAPAGARCILSLTSEGSLTVRTTTLAGKTLKSLVERTDNATRARFTMPVRAGSKSPGSSILVQIRALSGPIAVQSVSLEASTPDANNNGLGDWMDRFLAPAAGTNVRLAPRPPSPTTMFQTGRAYDPSIAVPTDAVMVHGNSPETIESWRRQGYTVYTMGGFRKGKEAAEALAGEVQTDAQGRMLAIGGDSFYMVPTARANTESTRYFLDALQAGAAGICPEEPEMFAQSGYSEAFKQEWQASYGSPWEAPTSSAAARMRSEQLKATLTVRQISTILKGAKESAPTAARMLALHSPITYAQWGIVMSHFALASLPDLQEIIGQVWTGTAKSAAKVMGARSERLFEVAALEYSSFYNLIRGTGKRLWFLTDPVEDQSGLAEDVYRNGYEQVTAAALLTGDVHRFEVMPWPERVFGRISSEYAVEVNTVSGALSEMWQHPYSGIVGGTEGIGVLFADSMALLRGEPLRSDFDAFYGMALPLFVHGIPVQAVSLDRIAEPGYLNRVKMLILSYDLLFPSGPQVHDALAAWVKSGGALMLVGGPGIASDIPDAWWRKAGMKSPMQDLLQRLFGAPLGVTLVRGPVTSEPKWSAPLASAQRATMGEANRSRVEVDLTPYAKAGGSALVRLQDIDASDGWGAWVASAELRIGGKLAASFRAGSEIESRFLWQDRDSRFNGEARFADGDAHWTYRFDNLPANQPVTLTLDIANGYVVRAASPTAEAVRLRAVDPKTDPTLAVLRVPTDYELTLAEPPAGAQVLWNDDQSRRPASWTARAGMGVVTYAGVSAAFLTATAQSARWHRALTKITLAAVKVRYAEAQKLMGRRGPYLAVRALGKEAELDGTYVNLLSPTLTIVDDPVIPAGGVGLLLVPTSLKRRPRLLAASGRLFARAESDSSLAFVVSAPSGTRGVARIWTGGKRPIATEVRTSLGAAPRIETKTEGNTLLVRYENDARGVAIRLLWKAPVAPKSAGASRSTPQRRTAKRTSVKRKIRSSAGKSPRADRRSSSARRRR